MPELIKSVTASASPPGGRILRWPSVRALLDGASRTKVDRLERAGVWPRRFQFGGGVAWLESACLAAIAAMAVPDPAQAEARREHAARMAAASWSKTSRRRRAALKAQRRQRKAA